MRRKHLTILISALVIAGILITTLFATGIIPIKVFNDISSDTDVDNESEMENSLKNENTSEGVEQQNPEENEAISRNIDEPEDNEISEDPVDNKKHENKIEVLNNSSEYEIEMYSYLDKSNNLCMEIDYYFDGVSHSELFEQSDFLGIENIFDIDNENLVDEEATVSNERNFVRLSNAILNTKYGKVYFTAERDLQSGEKAFVLYVLSLKDKTIKFLHKGEGYTLNASLLSPDKDFIAFNHFKDEKGNSSLIHIISSKDDTTPVIDNKTKDGRLIGSGPIEDELLKEGITVSYYLIRWRTLEDLKLREYSYVFDKTQNLITDEQSYEVSYNVLENTITYPEEKYASEGSRWEKDPKSKTDTDTEVGKDSGTDAGSGSGTEVDSEQDSSNGKGSGDSSDKKSDENSNSKSDVQQGTESSTGSGKQDSKGTNAEAGKQSDTPSRSQPGSPIEEGSSNGADKEAVNETDETDVTDGTEVNNKTDNRVSTDSEQVAVLKSFYKYVTESNYEKAYDLFDDNFQSTSKMFMGLKISKAEITLEVFQGVAEATQIFNNIKIENIIKEEQIGDSYKIYYTHSMVLDPNKEPQIYPLVVTLKKMAGTWRIMAVDDGIPGEEPFK